MDTNEKLLTAGEIAGILQMPEARVARYAKAGTIPHLRLPGGEIRFLAADVRAWLDGQRQAVACSQAAAPKGATP